MALLFVISDMKLELRKSKEEDLPIFFDHQADEEAIFMAAFTSKDPFDKEAYLIKWKKLLNAAEINSQTILIGEKVVGCVVKYIMEEQAEITYALDKAYWGKGITSEAVSMFLKLEKTRPVNAHVSFDNVASQKVLEKNGFLKTQEAMFFANGRGEEIKEFIYKLY